MARPLPIDTIRLPKGWRGPIKSAVLHAVSLAYVVLASARGRAANHRSERIRIAAELDAAQSQIAQLEEELRIKDARMAKLDPRHRPHYPPVDRLSILKLRAARGWSTADTADRFLLRPATITAWMARIDEGGEAALVQTAAPINRFPAFVEEIVASFKTVFPTAGKKRIAQILARAGLHLGVTTVKRMLEKKNQGPVTPGGEVATARGDDGGSIAPNTRASSTPVRAATTNHVWQIDLTVVPTTAGLWTAWFPFALPPCWPFCWWVACIIDHHSRRVAGFTVFPKSPTASEVRRFLDETTKTEGAKPKYLISDQGSQFTADELRAWCNKHGIDQRYASQGSLRATAVIERFFLSLKREWLERISLSLRHDTFTAQIRSYLAWYHAHRPHQGLGGKTPDEVIHDRRPAHRAPRFEPRNAWPRTAPCARPKAPPKRTRPHAGLILHVRFLDHERNLPIVELKRAA